ncbi:MAG: DUF421 domain-containing protein [Firmicutes bacterium]|nr:DUF421 domain-containing protein [Bacillota bacterium]
MGKAELSKVSTFQMVVLFMIAELAAMPIDSPSASIVNGIAAIFTLLFLEVLFSFLSVKSSKWKQLINGRPSVLIDDGKINVREMSRLRISLDDLLEQLRIENCPALTDAAYAVMEPNGELSVIKKTPPDVLPVTIISDGVLCDANMDHIGMSRTDLSAMLKDRGIEAIEDVFLAFYDTSRQFHVFTRPKKTEVFAKEVISCAR